MQVASHASSAFCLAKSDQSTSTSQQVSPAAGTVHHIAFRAPSDNAQLEWREVLSKVPLSVTPVLDRTYFHSIYFREPGGVLFEIATDPPGFAFDEPVEHLGEALKLPPWLEERRGDIAKVLPPIELPHLRKEQADA
jgi:glyoxalase family protein